MYLKDPTKRVQYSFRIKEDLMEDLKVYSEAKGVKIPRLLNDIIDEALDGMNLRNTWLDEPLNAIITIPNAMPMVYHENVLLPRSDGLPFEVKAMPVNLDTWNDKHGYIANSKELKHKGVEPLLIPSLIKDIELKNDEDTKTTLRQCLIALYFTLLNNDILHVELISHNNATGQLQFVNTELAKIYIHHRKVLDNIINEHLAMLNDVNHDSVKQKLLDQLDDLALTINTGNVVPITAQNPFEIPPGTNTLQSDNPYLGMSTSEILEATNPFGQHPPTKLYANLMDEIKELKEENQQYKDALEDMQNDLNDMEARQKIWEDIKKENEELHAQLNQVDDILKRLDELESLIKNNK